MSQESDNQSILGVARISREHRSYAFVRPLSPPRWILTSACTKHDIQARCANMPTRTMLARASAVLSDEETRQHPRPDCAASRRNQKPAPGGGPKSFGKKKKKKKKLGGRGGWNLGDVHMNIEARADCAQIREPPNLTFTYNLSRT